MTRARFLLPAAIIVALAGCGGKKDPLGGGPFGPSPGELTRLMFESPDADVRRLAIERLSAKSRGRRAPYPKAYAALASDPSATVRSAAVRALGRVGDSRYAETVVAALADPDETVRWDAAVALDALPDEQAVAPLADRAGADASVDVRAAAARALRHYRRRDVLAALLRGLEDSEFCVRFQAAGALAELTGESAGPEADEWRKLLAAKDDPFAPPARPKRPWWDLLGLTRPKKTPTTRPAAEPAPP